MAGIHERVLLLFTSFLIANYNRKIWYANELFVLNVLNKFKHVMHVVLNLIIMIDHDGLQYSSKI